MIRLGTLRELFAYNDWARDQLLQLCEGLDDAALDRPFEMGEGSLRRTLHHLWGAERIWLDRWKGYERARFAPLYDNRALSPAALHVLFRGTAVERDEYLAGKSDADLAAPVKFTNLRGESHAFDLGALALHVSNHGAHHRAQALNMLRRLGVTVHDIDYLNMAGARHASQTPQFDVDTIRTYYHYADWSRAQVDAAAAQLSDAQLDQAFEIGPGTLRRVLLHIRDAEQWWLENWVRGPLERFDELPPSTSLVQLRELFGQLAATRDALLARCNDAALLRPVRTRVPGEPGEYAFRLGATMLQLCLHGTHHRAQALNMLRHRGATPPGLDYVSMLRQGADATQPAARFLRR